VFQTSLRELWVVLQSSLNNTEAKLIRRVDANQTSQSYTVLYKPGAEEFSRIDKFRDFLCAQQFETQATVNSRAWGTGASQRFTWKPKPANGITIYSVPDRPK